MTKQDIIDDSTYSFKEIEQFLDEYVKQEAIAFSNWQLEGECEYTTTDENQWTHTYTRENITTEELYEIYKSTKNG